MERSYHRRSCLLAAALCLVVAQAAATDREHPEPSVQDKWFASDKALHFAVGAGVGAVGTALGDHNGLTYPRLTGFAAGCAAGLVKEGLDKRASSKDAVVTCLGAATGAFLAGVAITHERETKTLRVSYSREF